MPDVKHEAQNTKYETGGAVGVVVNGRRVEVPAGTVVAAAVARAEEAGFRKSVGGEMRGPLCGMGICFECRVTVDGVPQVRSCTLVCREGMEVRTDG